MRREGEKVTLPVARKCRRRCAHVHTKRPTKSTLKGVRTLADPLYMCVICVYVRACSYTYTRFAREVFNSALLSRRAHVRLRLPSGRRSIMCASARAPRNVYLLRKYFQRQQFSLPPDSPPSAQELPMRFLRIRHTRECTPRALGLWKSRLLRGRPRFSRIKAK